MKSENFKINDFVFDYLTVFLFLFYGVFSDHYTISAQNNLSPVPVIDLSKNPNIDYYSQQDFNADSQFWSVTEDAEAVMYFGNNDGILIFDGSHWTTVHLTNSSSVRSLAKGADGTIYAGGYNELGYIKHNEFGDYRFISLKESLQLQNVSFENIWQIDVIKERVIFRSFKKLFVLENGNVTQIPSKNSFIKSFLVGDRYFVQDANEGLYELNLDKNQISEYFSAEAIDNYSIVYISDNFDLITSNGKIFETNQKSLSLKQSIFEDSNDQIISVLKLDPSSVLLGTLSQGIKVLKKEGAGYHISSINSANDKTVLNLYKTSNGNVWALLDSGLEFLNYNSPRTTIFNQASVYDTYWDKDYFYVATNKGVYYSDLLNQNINPNSFKKLNDIPGQAWSFNELNGELFINHDKGLFKLTRDFTSERIGGVNGVWKTIKLKNYPNTYLVCTYEGIYILKNENGNWIIRNKVQGFDESSRDILATHNPNVFWICHGYKGVYRITLDKQLERAIAIDHFTEKNGLPAKFNINVFKWQDETVFSTNNGVYKFDEYDKRFKPYKPLNKIIDTTRNPRTIIDAKDKTWVVQDDELGFFLTNSNNPKIQSDIFLQTKGTFNRGMESITPLSENSLLVGTHNGLFLYDLSNTIRQEGVKTFFTKITYYRDQNTVNLPVDKDSIVEIPNNLNSIKFSFATPSMVNNQNIKFSYKLEDVDKDWSSWQHLAFKEYSLLTPGNYVFKVKSKNVLGNESKIASYQFYIRPKWYQSGMAYVGYAIIFLLLLITGQQLLARKIKKENQKSILKEQRANKLLQLEINQLKLEQDKEKIERDKKHLQRDIIEKSKELANYTMLLVNKKNFFDQLQEDLKELKQISKNKQSNQKILEIFKKMHRNNIDEQYLQVFDSNFESVHHEFFTNLKQKIPNLSKKELRLSAFIKMELSNKDIAPLLGISIRGVETARYRLRKKLNMEHDDNLMEFFESLKS